MSNPLPNPKDIKNRIEEEAKIADNIDLEKQRSSEEEEKYDRDVDRLLKTTKLEKQQHENANLLQDRLARKEYANKVFWLTCIWASLIFVVLFSNATRVFIFLPCLDFYLSDKVMITLITSTTINFFGFFLLVMRYLFHTNHPEPKPVPTSTRNSLSGLFSKKRP